MKAALTGLFILLLPVNTAWADSNLAKEEALLGLRVSSKGITYYVVSGGCTDKSDFEILNMESYPSQIKLVRTKADYCKKLVPDGQEIFFTWDEIGLTQGTPFKIVNPLQHFVVP